MISNVVIFGAGGHSRVVIAILEKLQFNILGVFDDSYEKSKETELISGYKLKGNLNNYDDSSPLVLAFGENKKRESLFNKYQNIILKENLIHPTSYIEANVIIGESNIILTFVLIHALSKIGNNNIINSRATIEHECEIGSHNHISVGVILCGRVKIGDSCFIGAGTVINDKVSICNNVIIGSNSTVINSINEPGTYAGSPVKRIK
jgi:sugar O-acyltransferase (sialic acid O-acetyltransferase NeuD family)